MTSIKDHNSITIWRKMAGNNPKLDLVNIKDGTKFNQILSISSQDFERKQNSERKFYHNQRTLREIREK